MLNSFLNDPVLLEAIRANEALGRKYADPNLVRMMDQLDEQFKSGNPVVLEPTPKPLPNDMDIYACRLVNTNQGKIHLPYSSPFNWGMDSDWVFPKLKEKGFELLNTQDFENSVRVGRLYDQAILFQDLEIPQVFKMTNHTVVDEENGESYNHILVRIYKVERLGTIKMKQAIFSKLKNLKRSVEELITITHAKEYNINVPYPNGCDDDFVIPYNVVGLLFDNEYSQIMYKYYENDHLYLDGKLSEEELKKKERLRKMFVRTTGREIFPYLNEPISKWKSATFDVDIAKTYNHRMIEMSTYHD